QEGLDLVVCAPAVPCGAAAETVEQAAGAHTTRSSPSCAREDRSVTPAGFPAGTAIIGVLEVKSAGSAASSPEPTSSSMVSGSAEAKTSAGAPCWICCTRVEDPATLSATSTPSCSASNASAISSKGSCSEAAA